MIVKKVIQIELGEEAVAALDEMRKNMDVSSYQDVFKRALKLYRWYLLNVVKGDMQLQAHNPKTGTTYDIKGI